MKIAIVQLRDVVSTSLGAARYKAIVTLPFMRQRTYVLIHQVDWYSPDEPFGIPDKAMSGRLYAALALYQTSQAHPT